MKSKNHLPAILGALLALVIILASCSSPKMSAVSCPDFSNGRYAKNEGIHSKKKSAPVTASRGTYAIKRNSGLSGKRKVDNAHASIRPNTEDIMNAPGSDEIASISKSEYSEALTASSDNSHLLSLKNNATDNMNIRADSESQENYVAAVQQSGCDTVILKSGSRIIGKVEEIGQSEIRYRRCDNITGPIISIAKSGVNRILYANGTHEIMVSDSPIVLGSPEVKPVYSSSPVKSEPLGIIGLISGLVGLFVAGVPLGALGVVFGAISLGKVKREPARFKGRGIAIASMVIGLIALVGAIIVMSAL